jgi:hypothetical protein
MHGKSVHPLPRCGNSIQSLGPCHLRDLSAVSSPDLIVQAITRLGFGAAPIENWACYFAPEMAGVPRDQPLANRAFCIWFPTTLDFIAAEPGMRRLQAHASARGVDVDRIATLAYELSERMRKIARLLSREDQIFIRDRRLQYVHGSLEYFVAENRRVSWFDHDQNRILSEEITEAALHYQILRPFNARHAESQAELRLRVVRSSQWIHVKVLIGAHGADGLRARA